MYSCYQEVYFCYQEVYFGDLSVLLLPEKCTFAIQKVHFRNHKVYQVALLVQNDHFTVEKSIGRRGVKL